MGRVAIGPDTSADAAAERVRAWVAEHVPDAWRDAGDRGGAAAVRAARSRAEYEAWYPVFGRSGLVVPTWPTRYGGLDVSPAVARVIEGVPEPSLGTFPVTVDGTVTSEGLLATLRLTEWGGRCTTIGQIEPEASLPLFEQQHCQPGMSLGVFPIDAKHIQIGRFRARRRSEEDRSMVHPRLARQTGTPLPGGAGAWVSTSASSATV